MYYFNMEIMNIISILKKHVNIQEEEEGMNFTEKEKTFLKNLVEDKIDIAERNIRRFNKDYKHYQERMNWIPGIQYGSNDSKYIAELKRQIMLEENKIAEYKELVGKIING